MLISDIWKCCIIISVIVLLVFLVLEIRGRKKHNYPIDYAMTGVFVAITLLVFPHYLFKENLIPGLFESILASIQAFLLHGSFLPAVQSAETLLPHNFMAVYAILIGSLYLLAPALAARFIFDFIRTFLSSSKLKYGKVKELYIFSDLNARSLALASSIDEKQNKDRGKTNSAIVFAGVLNSDDPEKNILRQQAIDLGYTCIRYQQIPAKMIRRKNMTVYFMQMSDNEDRNLQSAIEIIGRYRESDLNTYYLHVLSTKPEAEIILDSIKKGSIQTRIINESQICAYHLFDEIPLYKAIDSGCKKLSILLIGADKVGKEVLKTAFWCGQMADIELEINVVDSAASKWRSKLYAECPELMQGEYRIYFHEAEAETKEFYDIIDVKCKESNYVIVTQESEDSNIQTAIGLRRHFISSDSDFMRWPIITLLIRSDEKYDVIKQLQTEHVNSTSLSGYDLKPFGTLKTLFSHSIMFNSPLEKLAINVHALYESNYKNDDEISLEKILPSFSKYELFRRSNMANALHIKYKLWYLGLTYTEKQANLIESDYSLSIDDINKLVEVEHMRWVAFQRAEGWKSSTVEETKKYMHTGLNDKHKHPIAKLHPCICDTNQLKTMCNEFDPKFIEYDTNFIVRIPDILHDKWGLTGETYSIIQASDDI